MADALGQLKLAQAHEAAQFLIDCTEPAFKSFLHAEHGFEPPFTDERARQHTLRHLGVNGRLDIATDEAARAEWQQMLRDFEKWRVS